MSDVINFSLIIVSTWTPCIKTLAKFPALLKIIWTERKKMYCNLKGKIATLVAIGLMLAITGCVFYITFPLIMKSQIEKRMILAEGSQTYEYWKQIPFPIYIRLYVFNVTNPYEVWNMTEKPILEELGPFTFREAREKVNITWNDNGTVTYRQIKRWYFQPDLTNGSLDDNVTSLNVPLVAAAAQAKEMNFDFVYYAVSELIEASNSTWFVFRTVKELLFEGYEDPLIDAARTIIHIPYDKFGWFYGLNNTDDGEFVVYTGKDDIDNLDTVYTWNGEQSTKAYDPPCNKINGTAGDVFHPYQTKEDKLTMFITNICRSFSFTYLKETSVKSLKAYRYWADNTQLDNGQLDPANECFCSYDGCLPTGGVSVNKCKFNAPAVVSYPHFLFADSSYSQGVIGMHPNPKKHEMYLDILPEMGIPLKVAARMQINVKFENISRIPQLSNFSETIFWPTIWFSETAEASDKIIEELKLPLQTMPMISNIACFVVVSVGAFLVLTALVLSILYAFGQKEPVYTSVSPK